MSAMKYHRRILMSSGAEETPHEKADPLGAAFECGEDVIVPALTFDKHFARLKANKRR